MKCLSRGIIQNGCDSGFGHLLAHRLDSLGYKVFAGCLAPDGEGAKKLRHSSSDKLHVLGLDVTDDNSVKEARNEVTKYLDGCDLWAVVNNAGIIVRGESEWTPLEDYKKQFEVNTFGVVRVTQAFLPLLRRYRGRVVTTASFGGRATCTGFVPYCMSKYATISFCEGLRMEMAKFNVKVVTVEPFPYSSDMTDSTVAERIVDATWAKASDEVKMDYGNGYIHAFKAALNKYIAKTTSPNVFEVIDTLVEAVTCTSPHYSYKVGDLRCISFSWLSLYAPKLITDYVMRKYVTFDTDIENFLRKKEAASNHKMS